MEWKVFYKRHVDGSLNRRFEYFKNLFKPTSFKFDRKQSVHSFFAFFKSQVENVLLAIFWLVQYATIRFFEFFHRDRAIICFSNKGLYSLVRQNQGSTSLGVKIATFVSKIEFAMNKINDLTTGIEKFKKAGLFCLTYQPPGKKQTHLRVNVDASYADIGNIFTFVIVLILLCVKRNVAHILDYSNQIYQQVVWYTIKQERCASSETFDKTYIVPKDFCLLTEILVYIISITSSKQIFIFSHKEKLPEQLQPNGN